MTEKDMRDLLEEMQKLRVQNQELEKKFAELSEFVHNSLGDTGGTVYLDGVDDSFRREIMKALSPGRK